MLVGLLFCLDGGNLDVLNEALDPLILPSAIVPLYEENEWFGLEADDSARGFGNAGKFIMLLLFSSTDTIGPTDIGP